MSCETNYGKLAKQTPALLKAEEKSSTGYGNLDLLLRIRAANFWHESLVTLSDQQLINYCRQTIDYQYPNLRTRESAATLYQTLQNPDKDSMQVIYNYQWWLGNVIGPQSCTRDIAYLGSLLGLTPNEEWTEELEEAVLDYQIGHTFIEVPTGYGCAETFKRLRLQE